MWRKVVQSTYRRKDVRRAPDAPDIPRNEDKHVFFLGALAHVWGGIEDLLDNWVESIHANGGAKLIQAQLPPNLDRELDYLKAAIKAGLVPEASREDASRLIQQVHRIKGFRHILIHSRLIEIAPDGRAIVDHARVKGSRRIRMRVTFRRPQMLRHYGAACELLDELTLFVIGEHTPESDC